MRFLEITSIDSATGSLLSAKDHAARQIIDLRNQKFTVYDRIGENFFCIDNPFCIRPIRACGSRISFSDGDEEIVRIIACEFKKTKELRVDDIVFVNIAGDYADAGGDIGTYDLRRLSPAECWYMTIQTAQKYGFVPPQG